MKTLIILLFPFLLFGQIDNQAEITVNPAGTTWTFEQNTFFDVSRKWWLYDLDVEKHGKIAFFGDSWVNSGNLHEYFYDAFSYGVPGATAERLYSHVDSVIVRKPDTVILIVGVNDYVQRVGYADFYRWRHEISYEFYKAGIKTYVLQIPDADYQNAYDNFLGELARDFRAWWRGTNQEALDDYNDFYDIAFPEMKPEHYRDPVHLNQEGIKVLAEHIKKHLIN